MLSEKEDRAELLRSACPACQAPPGERCTSPTNTARREVRWIHLARYESNQEARRASSPGDEPRETPSGNAEAS